MAGLIGSTAARTAAKLAVAVTVLAAGMAMAGLPVRLPAPPAKPAPAKIAPQPLPVAASVAPVQDPAAYVIKGALTLDGPMKHGDYVWDTSAAPQGPILITIDLEAQMLSVFRGGYEIGVAVIVYGAGEKPTPLGSFAITEKDADHVSNLYDAPMPYMQRLTDDGISIHGSPVIGPDRATHGCIGVPTAFAKLLFGQTRLGDRVVITSGEVLQLGGRVPTA